MGERDIQSGWVSWTADSWVDLPPATRAEMQRTMIERHRARGPLAAIVQVRVFADGAEPSVSFTADCTLGPESDHEEIAAAVARAREALADWR